VRLVSEPLTSTGSIKTTKAVEIAGLDNRLGEDWLRQGRFAHPLEFSCHAVATESPLSAKFAVVVA